MSALIPETYAAGTSHCHHLPLAITVENHRPIGPDSVVMKSCSNGNLFDATDDLDQHDSQAGWPLSSLDPCGGIWEWAFPEKSQDGRSSRDSKLHCSVSAVPASFHPDPFICGEGVVHSLDGQDTPCAGGPCALGSSVSDTTMSHASSPSFRSQLPLPASSEDAESPMKALETVEVSLVCDAFPSCVGHVISSHFDGA